MTSDDEVLDVQEILALIDPLGKAMFETALERLRVKKLVARVESLEKQVAEQRGEPRHRPSRPVQVVEGETA